MLTISPPSRTRSSPQNPVTVKQAQRNGSFSKYLQQDLRRIPEYPDTRQRRNPDALELVRKTSVLDSSHLSIEVVDVDAATLDK